MFRCEQLLRDEPSYLLRPPDGGSLITSLRLSPDPCKSLEVLKVFTSGSFSGISWSGGGGKQASIRA